jgi:hypothetical protein
MTRVRVPHRTGEVTIKTGRAGVEEELHFTEEGGFVEVPAKHLDLFLGNVPDSAIEPDAGEPGEGEARSPRARRGK